MGGAVGGLTPPKLPVRAGEGVLQGTVGHSLTGAATLFVCARARVSVSVSRFHRLQPRPPPRRIRARDS